MHFGHAVVVPNSLKTVKGHVMENAMFVLFYKTNFCVHASA